MLSLDHDGAEAAFAALRPKLPEKERGQPADEWLFNVFATAALRAAADGGALGVGVGVGVGVGLGRRCVDPRPHALTMALLTMALPTMALLTMALLTMALLTMALLTMALLTMALLY